MSLSGTLLQSTSVATRTEMWHKLRLSPPLSFSPSPHLLKMRHATRSNHLVRLDLGRPHSRLDSARRTISNVCIHLDAKRFVACACFRSYIWNKVFARSNLATLSFDRAKLCTIPPLRPQLKVLGRSTKSDCRRNASCMREVKRTYHSVSRAGDGSLQCRRLAF